MLSVSGIHTFYGRIEALKGVDIEIGKGEIVTLIGANGAGKTTLLLTLCANPKAASGSIRFEGEEISGLPTFEIVRKGIAISPEGRRIFPRMSVFENLKMGAVTGNPAHFDEDIAKVLKLFPRLEERLDQRGGTLSGGEQQMLSIARALMARPKLLLLDEPSLGLAPMVVRQIFEIVAEIRKQGVTVFLVEQNAYHALKLADRGYVMVNGEIALSGSGQELLANAEIRRAYLEGGH